MNISNDPIKRASKKLTELVNKKKTEHPEQTKKLNDAFDTLIQDIYSFNDIYKTITHAQREEYLTLLTKKINSIRDRYFESYFLSADAMANYLKLKEELKKYKNEDKS